MINNNSGMSRLFQQAGTGQAQQGTGYTNLNKLFTANQNNQLGNKVADDIGTQVGGIKTQLNQQVDQFNKDASANNLNTEANQNKVKEVVKQFGDTQNSGGTLSDQDASDFQKFIAGNYAGPSGLADTSNLSSTASGLAKQTSNLSPSGTQELLRRSVGGNNYSQGQSRLDSLLMDRSKLTPITRQAQGLGQDINKQNLAASGTAELYKNQSQDFANKTKGQLGTAQTGINTTVDTALASARTQEGIRQDLLKKLTDPANTGVTGLSNIYNTLQTSGLVDPSKLNSVFGADPSSVYSTLQNQYNSLKGATYNANDWAKGLITGTGGFDRYGNAPAQALAKQFRDTANSTALGKSILATIPGYQGASGDQRLNSQAPDLTAGSDPLIQKLLTSIKANSTGNLDTLSKSAIASDAQIHNFNVLQKLMGNSEPTDYTERTQMTDPNTGRLMTNPDNSPMYNSPIYKKGTIDFDPTKF